MRPVGVCLVRVTGLQTSTDQHAEVLQQGEHMCSSGVGSHQPSCCILQYCRKGYCSDPRLPVLKAFRHDVVLWWRHRRGQRSAPSFPLSC